MTTCIFNDDVKTTLLESITTSATTIKVANPRGVYRDTPEPGVDEVATLKIVDRINEPTRREVITYTGRNTITGGYELTGVTRGESLTTALPWEADCYVVGMLTASDRVSGSLPNVDSQTLLGRNTFGTGAVEVLTVATVKTMLGITDGTSGLSYVPMTMICLDERLVSFDAETSVHGIEFLDTFMLIWVSL